ncbi:MAG: hypothetical protein KAT79_03885, partial [candidate division Zixibacteria bacterium]|nr:hypothetical protein [candidate division Zixibacteria bacterium]
MIDAHTLKALEFAKVVSMMRGKCLTPYGKEKVSAIEPLFEKTTIDRKQLEISQMQDILKFGQAFPLYNLEDCRELLNKATVEGIYLDPKDILIILELVRVSIELHNYDKEGRENFPAIAAYLDQIRAFPELRKEIARIFDEHGEIKDNASSTLKRIRIELGDTRRKIISMLERTLAARQKQPGWQDDMVTTRNGRYVIPIPSSQYRSDIGILHDRSQTGATLFVEPAGSVDANNRINILQQEERQELDRILRAITREIAQRVEPLLQNAELIGQLDAIYACGKFAVQTKAERPVIIDRPAFDLIDARHPLLMVQFDDQEQVIANSVALGDGRQVILVTGPNTGGKTILLKTVGLSVLMAQSGLPIPANAKSEVGIFSNLFADIGDEQSIELSLSTFSSHVRNIIDGLRNVGNDVLLLFDEIGAGTDPKEGAALAEAIIMHTIRHQTRLIATTHYSQLKTMATEHPEVENASLDFNLETLAPTYRLNMGIPGSSYAVEIANRLGMPDDICKHASSLVGTGEKSLTALISSLQDELATVKEDKVRLNERLSEASRLEKEYTEKSNHLENEIEDEKKRKLAETDVFLDHTRKEIEKLVAEIRKSQASKQSVQQFHHNLQKRQHHVEKLKRKAAVAADELVEYNVG